MVDKKELTYKDQETGHILFGQAMLDRHTAELKSQNDLQEKRNILEEKRQRIEIIRWIVIFVSILALFWYIHNFNVLNNIVAKCVG